MEDKGETEAYRGISAEKRRKAIIEYLSVHKQATRDELASYFEVSRETIRIDLLKMPYAPVETKPGIHGGIFILQDFQYGNSFLTQAEEECLDELIEIVNDGQKRILYGIKIRFSQDIVA